MSDVPTLVKRDQDGRAADVGTDVPCGETEGLRILDEFRKLYESRIEKIDREPGGESDRISVSDSFVCVYYQLCNFSSILSVPSACNLKIVEIAA